jgi:hypothetical protein
MTYYMCSEAGNTEARTYGACKGGMKWENRRMAQLIEWPHGRYCTNYYCRQRLARLHADKYRRQRQVFGGGSRA